MTQEDQTAQNLPQQDDQRVPNHATEEQRQAMEHSYAHPEVVLATRDEAEAYLTAHVKPLVEQLAGLLRQTGASVIFTLALPFGKESAVVVQNVTGPASALDRLYALMGQSIQTNRDLIEMQDLERTLKAIAEGHYDPESRFVKDGKIISEENR